MLHSQLLPQLWKWSRLSLELLTQGLKVVAVDVGVSQGVHKLARLEANNMGNLENDKGLKDSDLLLKRGEFCS